MVCQSVARALSGSGAGSEEVLRQSIKMQNAAIQKNRDERQKLVVARDRSETALKLARTSIAALEADKAKSLEVGSRALRQVGRD